MEGDLFETFLSVALPATAGVGVVIATVVFMFWYGAGRPTSYEDDVKARQGHAEKEMRKLAEKEKQKKEKKRGGERRRRQEVVKQQRDVEDTPHLPPAQKSILKSSRANNVSKVKIDSSATSRVDFELTETPVKSRGTRTNPPTPHPSAQRPSLNPLTRALEEREAEEELLLSQAPDAEPRKKGHEEEPPAPKTKVAVSMPVTTPTKASAGGASRGQKKAKKAKQPVDLGTMEALPASRISDIVGASLLSDDDIQQLIEQLLEKMNANAEWQGTSKGTESVKSLKKANEDLQQRCKDAEKTVQTHYNKIKDLRQEIQREQSRRQASEGHLQAKITQQTGEITIFKSKVTGLEDELKQTKQLSSSHAYQKLEEEHATLSRQMATLVQENASLTTELASRSKTLQEAQDHSTRLLSDLHRAKNAAKGSGGEGRGHAEKVTELEERLRQAEDDNLSLQSAVQSVQTEKDQLAEKAQSLPGVTRERDGLAQQLSAIQQQLQQAQMSIQTLEQKETEGNEKEEKLRGEIQQLRDENHQLSSQVDVLEQHSAEAAQALQQQQQQQQQPAGVSAEQVEEIKAQLQAAHANERKTLTEELQAERSAEVAGLKGQYEAELHSVKEELSRVLRTWEEEKSSAEKELASETAEKRALQSELETLRLAAAATQSPQQNGPVGNEDQVDLAQHEEMLQAKEEALARAVGERDELKDKLRAAETKLDELKGKNNTLRDNCWKARDDTATVQKDSEAKLKQVYRETEDRVKAAEAAVYEKMEEGQRALLQRLFPDVAVDAVSFPTWVDLFESQAQLTVEATKKQLCVLTERVAELEDTEQTYIQLTKRLKETLNTTFGNLAKLQTQVNGENIKQVRLLEERDEMLQQERVSNRDLQQLLSKEKETTANLEAQLKKVGSVEAEHQEQVRGLEGRLEESSQERETLLREVDTLRDSLQQVTQLKTTAEETIVKLETKCDDLAKKCFESEESLQSTVDLGKITQSIIPSDSTEV